MRTYSISNWITAIWLCTILSTVAASQTVRHYKERVDDTPAEIAQAEDAIQKNDFSGAEALLRKAIEKDSSNYQAWFDLGFVLNRLNRTDDSIAAYRKSVAARPDVFESNLNLALMLIRANNPEAEQFLRAATGLKPTAHVEDGRERAWLALAHLLDTTKPEDALAAYRKASELMPRDTEPHISAGLLLERQKDFAGAEDEYKKVLTLAPQSTEAAIGLTNLYMKSGKLAEAEPLLRKLAAARPNEAGIHLQLGRVLAAENKKDDAIAELQTVLKLAPQDADAKGDLAELLGQSQNLPDAEKLYRDLVRVHPSDADAHEQLGEVLLKEHRFTEAEQEFMAAVKIKPDLGVAYGSLAIAANETQNYLLTIKALEVRAKLLPENPPSYFLRATALDHLKDYKHAGEYYHHFLDAASGKYPNEEWKARHRLVWIESKKH